MNQVEQTGKPSAGRARDEATAIKTIKVECFRFNPEVDQAPSYQTFEVPHEGEMRVLDCLEYIREHLDPTLAFFVNCKRGGCGRCLMRVNGRPKMACLEVVAGDFRVEPLRTDNVIRDLWTETT